MTEEKEETILSVKITNPPKEIKETEDFPDETFDIPEYITEEEIKEFEDSA